MHPALEPTEAPSPARVLLAEDDFELRSLLGFVLRADGHDVIEASNGNELQAMLCRPSGQAGPHHFSLVISDLRMPGLTALDVLSKFHAELQGIPVILITAFGDQATHLRARQLGASCVIDKPFDFDELREAVHQALHERTRRAS